MKKILIAIVSFGLGFACIKAQGGSLIGIWTVQGKRWIEFPFDTITMVRKSSQDLVAASEGSEFIFTDTSCTIHNYASGQPTNKNYFLSGETDFMYPYQVRKIDSGLTLVDFGNEGCVTFALKFDNNLLRLSSFVLDQVKLQFQPNKRGLMDKAMAKRLVEELKHQTHCNKGIGLIVNLMESTKEKENLGEVGISKLRNRRSRMVLNMLKKRAACKFILLHIETTNSSNVSSVCFKFSR